MKPDQVNPFIFRLAGLLFTSHLAETVQWIYALCQIPDADTHKCVLHWRSRSSSYSSLTRYHEDPTKYLVPRSTCNQPSHSSYQPTILRSNLMYVHVPEILKSVVILELARLSANWCFVLSSFPTRASKRRSASCLALDAPTPSDMVPRTHEYKPLTSSIPRCLV